MFYGQCNDCGERWELGTVSTCKCPDLVTWDASAPIVTTPHPAFKKPWVGLTDEEIVGMTCECVDDGTFNMDCARDFARAIEAKLKGLNT
jgi:hypothetical protein